jgi:hypothetical protein
LKTVIDKMPYNDKRAMVDINNKLKVLPKLLLSSTNICCYFLEITLQLLQMTTLDKVPKKASAFRSGKD